MYTLKHLCFLRVSCIHLFYLQALPATLYPRTSFPLLAGWWADNLRLSLYFSSLTGNSNDNVMQHIMVMHSIRGERSQFTWTPTTHSVLRLPVLLHPPFAAHVRVVGGRSLILLSTDYYDCFPLLVVGLESSDVR